MKVLETYIVKDGKELKKVYKTFHDVHTNYFIEDPVTQTIKKISLSQFASYYTALKKEVE